MQDEDGLGCLFVLCVIGMAAYVLYLGVEWAQTAVVTAAEHLTGRLDFVLEAIARFFMPLR